MVKDKEEKTDIDQEQEIVQILGIRRKWLDVALKIYSVIFCAYSFFVIREGFSIGKPIMEASEAIVVHLAAFSVVETMGLIVLFQGADFLMYLTEIFRAKLQRKVEKARIEGKAEGKDEGKAEVYKAVDAWNKRRLEAEAKGLPFDEPPPTNS
jgi:hypothetical protein